jgi:hypothetical protein
MSSGLCLLYTIVRRCHLTSGIRDVSVLSMGMSPTKPIDTAVARERGRACMLVVQTVGTVCNEVQSTRTVIWTFCNRDSGNSI